MTGRRGIRFRLTVGLLLVVSAAVGGSAWAVFLLQRNALEQDLKRQAGGLARMAGETVRRERDRIERDLLAVARDLAGPASAVVARAVDPDTRHSPGVVLAASRYGKLTGLTVLALVARDGTVLSSAHWAEQIGLPFGGSPTAPSSDPRRALLATIGTGDGDRPALVAEVSAGPPQDVLRLVGGTIVDDRFLRSVSNGGETTAWLAGEGRWSADDGPLEARAVEIPSALLEPPPQRGGPAARGAVIRDAAGQPRLVATVWLEGAPDPGVLVVTRLPATSGVGVNDGTVLAVVLLGVTLIAAVTGAWILRSVTRPLEVMIHAVEAVSRGEADYTYPAQGRDEFGALVESFSRMRRSLVHQQDRLRTAERVAAWREAARRVAHEIKNPLAPIRLSMENLLRARRDAPDRFDEIFDEAAGAVLEEVERLRRIVTEFSEFARLPEPVPEPADLDRIVDSVLALHPAGEAVRLRREREDGPLAVQVDSDQISRAVRNVVDNAYQALQGRGGEIVVRTSSGARHVAVEISDDGSGFDPGSRERVFDPYFTTREAGTGLGLAIAARFVTDHGGSIVAENRPEGGARVTIRLPRGASP